MFDGVSSSGRLPGLNQLRKCFSVLSCFYMIFLLSSTRNDRSSHHSNPTCRPDRSDTPILRPSRALFPSDRLHRLSNPRPLHKPSMRTRHLCTRNTHQRRSIQGRTRQAYLSRVTTTYTLPLYPALNTGTARDTITFFHLAFPFARCQRDDHIKNTSVRLVNPFSTSFLVYFMCLDSPSLTNSSALRTHLHAFDHHCAMFSSR